MAQHALLVAVERAPLGTISPRSPRQRGSNENTDRLLRQYLPRGFRFSLATGPSQKGGYRARAGRFRSCSSGLVSAAAR
jgi:IS30 family transposase